MTIIERRRFRQNHLRKELLRKMSAAVPCDPFQYVTDAAIAGMNVMAVLTLGSILCGIIGIIDGGLIGGASLKPVDFATIIAATNQE